MKIAIIGTAYPFRGGLAAYNERLAHELKKEGQDVTIYTFTMQYPKFLFPGKTQLSDNKATHTLNIIRCIHSLNPINWIKTGIKIKKQNYDTVIIKYWIPFMGPCFGTILRLIKRNKKTKVLCIFDNIIPHEKRCCDNLFTRYFIKPVDYFIAMSGSVMKDFDTFNIGKPKILSPHPLFDNFGEILDKEEALKYLNLDPSFRYVLFFGLIRKYKGLDLLLRAFADPRIKTRNIKLIIAGEYYTDREEYLAIIREYRLENHVVEINRFIPDPEVKYFFSAADLVTLPYKSATQSGVTQIAMHFNKPLLITHVGGLKELFTEKIGYIVSPDAGEIAQAITDFYTKDQEREITSNILKEKEKYTWNVLTSNIYKLLSNQPLS